MEDSQIYTSKKLKDEKIEQEENLDDDEDENKNNPELFFSLMNESKYDIENIKEISSVKLKKENEENKKIEDNNNKEKEDNEEEDIKLKDSNLYNILIEEGSTRYNKKDYIDIKEKTVQKEIMSHTEYVISLNKRNSNKKEIQIIILSYRRYEHFNIFYNAMKIKYPYFIYPKLSEKNVMVKINQDQEFMERRRKQLKFLLNYFAFHPKLNQKEEFIKFLKDPIFDEKYFLNINSPYDYPETKKYFNSNPFYPLSYFKNLFNDSKNIQIEPNENQKKFTSMISYYNKMYDNIFEMVQTLNNYYHIFIKSKDNYNDLSRNLSYLNLKKNFKNKNENNIIYDEMISLSKNLSNMEKEFSDKFMLLVNEPIDEFMLMLKGVCEALERYSQYIETYKSVIYAGNNFKEKDNVNNLQDDEEKIKEEIELRKKQFYEKKGKLGEEVANANKHKFEYEKELNREYEDFISKYSNSFNSIMNSLMNTIYSLNSEQMQRINTIFKNEINS
jgi:hypothetical protein